MLVGVIEVSLIILVGNLIYFTFYKGNFAFIEKYKAVDEFGLGKLTRRNGTNSSGAQ